MDTPVNPETLPTPPSTAPDNLLAQACANIVKPLRIPAKAYEYKVVALRECPTSDSMALCDTPDTVADYWRQNIAAHPYYNPDVECLAVLLVNTRRRVKGHHLISIGTLDTVLIHPREVFRMAIMVSASALILAHNHPSGDPSPSESDIRETRAMYRAGQLLKIEVLDHVIIGHPKHASMKELGYFYN